MPPIMGAAAFLMAEMVGVQYSEIAMRAIFPALLYFTGIFITVHLEAKRLGLKGIAKEDLPKFVPLFIRQGYLLIPLVTLVAMVMMGYTMSRSAVIATLLAILVSIPNKSTRMNPTRFVNALETGGKNTLSVAVACGIAGIIAGVVTMTGLGQILISAIVSVAGDRVIIALFLTMLTCIVLGMDVLPERGERLIAARVFYSALPMEPNSSILVFTVSLMAAAPGARSFLGSKPFPSRSFPASMYFLVASAKAS